MSMLNRLLTLSYWLEAGPGPLSLRGQALYLALGLLLAAGVALSLWACRRRLQPGGWWAAEGLSCGLGLAAVALRLAAVPGWQARAWLAAPAAWAFVLAPALLALAPDQAALRRGWCDLWAFRPALDVPKLPARLALLGLHAAALAVSVRLAGWPLRAAPALYLALLAPQLLGCLARPPRPLAPLALNALLPAYLLAGALAAGRIALYLGWPAPPAWLGALPLGPALATLAVYACAYQVYTLWPGERRVLAWVPPALLGGAGLAWAAWAYVTLYARGVSGSDPYCYVQMAVDLWRHGTLLHRFPLAPLAGALQIDPEPLLHVGYRLPLSAAGWAATVWPAGHSVLLGLAGRLAGERAIYLATPLMGLASIAATIWLGALLFDDLPRPLAWLAGSVGGLLVATSYEQLRWVLVHMADVSAQLFSVLTIALVVAGNRLGGRCDAHKGLGYGRQGQRARRACLAAAGLALALAYWTRHTQLAMALPALALAALAGPARPRHQRLYDGALYLGASLLGALPDLCYHALLFGSPLVPESKELALYALQAVPATTALVVREWLARRELLCLAPLLLAGALALVRRNRRAALALALWLGALWAVQAPYSALRLRDLLPALPALALLAGYGVAWALAWLARWRRAAATLLALAVVALLWLRTADTATLPWRRSFNNFGYLWPSQRGEFSALQGRLEPNAAIGATLNSGAVDLYAGRDTFLPAGWPPGDLERFLRALQVAGRPTYLLDDGAEMAPVLAGVRAYARVAPAATLRLIPYYAPDGGSELRDVVMYRVETKP